MQGNQNGCGGTKLRALSMFMDCPRTRVQGLDRKVWTACGLGHIYLAVQALALEQSMNLDSALSLGHYRASL